MSKGIFQTDEDTQSEHILNGLLTMYLDYLRAEWEKEIKFLEEKESLSPEEEEELITCYSLSYVSQQEKYKYL